MAMDETKLDQLVSSMYRAATGAHDWTEPLRGIQQAFGALTAVLHSLDFSRSGQLVSLQHGEEDTSLEQAVFTYVREWHLLDPRRERFLAAGPAVVGQWLHCTDAFDEQYVHQHPFYQHYLLAHGGRYNSSIGLPVSEDVATVLVLELPRNRGPLSTEERYWADRVAKHLQDALRAYERVRKMAAQALAGHQLLCTFPYPIWLIDADRFVMFSSASSAVALEQDRWVVIQQNRLKLRNSRNDRRLTECLSGMASAPHGSRQLVDARHHPSEPPTWLHLMAVRPMEVMGAFGDRPFILATLLSPDQVRPLDPHALGEIFGFTPMQARVAVALADGLTAREIAERVGCAEPTVRTHLRVVMEKLGARRLADAIRLLRQGDALWACASTHRR